MSIDDLIKERKIEEHEFNMAMFDHIDKNPKGCDPMGDCIYCLTYGDHLRDAEGR